MLIVRHFRRLQCIHIENFLAVFETLIFVFGTVEEVVFGFSQNEPDRVFSGVFLEQCETESSSLAQGFLSQQCMLEYYFVQTVIIFV